ncbi:MAG: hypothetical protein Q8919_14240, partial [Bacteroidota bacterium]|nr:hypothetical protein [Bacteroidota bacterium]
PYSDLILAIGLLILTGFFANPNLLGFHRFYRDKLAAVYMKSAGNGDKALKVRELVDHEGKMNSPYPLINTCLNLFGKNEDQYRGMKTEDYFLFSPLYSGAKLTGYVDTTDRRFRNITVSTATAISGAAFNSVMGRKTNKIASFALTVLNARTGYWAYNPKKEYRAGLSLIDWWPAYHLRELFGDTDTDRRRVNLSDGGHIENLAVYELLRRRCKLIVAVDASADPGFKFDDLNNLVIRSSNELGLCITFRQKPEDLIKPDASNGFSESQFVIGDITALPGNEECASYHGILVYVKSSMLPQRRWIDREQTTRKGKEMESYLYKTYHPKFPHESTADQFFDSDQWNAYYYLGKFMAAYVLGIELPEHDDLNDVELPISFTGSSADAIIEQLMRTVERARR